MAIVTDDGDYLIRSTSLWDYNAAYTWMAWVKLVSDLNNYGHIFVARLDNSNYEHLGLGTNGTVLRNEVNGAESDEAGSTLTVGTWYHLALVRASATSFSGYVNGVLDLGPLTTNVGARSPQINAFIGTFNAGYPANIAVAHCKIWTAALTTDEILQESRVARPIRFGDLYSFSPLFAVGDVADYSGNGYGWEAVGTVVTSDGPPVTWGAPGWVPPFADSSGAQAVTPDHLTNTATVHSPTVLRGAVTIVPDHLPNTSTVHSPTVTRGAVTLTPDSITSGAAVYQPTVSPGAVTIAPDPVTNTSTVYSPTITTGEITIAPDVIANTSTVHSPTITTGVTIAPDHLTSSATVYAPVVSTGAVTVAPDHLTNASTIHSPVVGVGAVTIAPDHLASTATVHSPTVVASGVIAPDHLTNSSVVYSPVISTGAVTIAPDSIASGLVVYQPTVTSAVTILPDTIASTAIVYSPTITTGAVTIAPDHLTNVSIVYSPFVGSGETQTVALNHLVNTTQFWTLVLLLIPSNRIYRIAVENRVYVVGVESRVYPIGAESRVLTIRGD